MSPSPRWVVVKCEANSQGTNRRAVVTNRRGARTLPQGAYEEYAERGESENRNKELKCELSTDRLSDHRYMANSFRMFLHCLANNLLVLLRQTVATPSSQDATPITNDPAPDPFTGEPLPFRSRTTMPLHLGGTRSYRTRTRRTAPADQRCRQCRCRFASREGIPANLSPAELTSMAGNLDCDENAWRELDAAEPVSRH